jgi:hypothetical protein
MQKGLASFMIDISPQKNKLSDPGWETSNELLAGTSYLHFLRALLTCKLPPI